ncbi:hypothetical protein HYFRA_00012838 [Hymenoscyphus fraxineus]|uniref:J domain-containing protein n=1 Tax=Hymenoscyphus fraxineus TaxID=746836 RepID=A0A9N9L6M0_9HELO|nr:hypothetical protein HYFRA_00012838 [Hymenoscyphus fraxineus]
MPREFTRNEIEKDLYARLECRSDATHDALEAAFNRLALKYHPNRNPSAEAHDMFKEIKFAWDILGNEADRAEYNRWRGVGVPQGQMGIPDPVKTLKTSNGPWSAPPEWPEPKYDGMGAYRYFPDGTPNPYIGNDNLGIDPETSLESALEEFEARVKRNEEDPDFAKKGFPWREF